MRGMTTGLLGLALTVGGCAEGLYDPEYPVAKVHYDAGLVGTWVGSGDDRISMEFAALTLPVRDGLIRPSEEKPVRVESGVGAGDGPAAAESADPNAYTVTALSGEDAEPVVCHGYLLELGGATFLGIQPTLSQLNKGAPFPLVVPTHVLVKIRRNGRELELWAPNTWVAWAPGVVTWLDGPATMDDSAPIEPGSIGKGKVGLTQSLERLLRFNERHADDAALFEHTVTLQRADGEVGDGAGAPAGDPASDG